LTRVDLYLVLVEAAIMKLIGVTCNKKGLFYKQRMIVDDDG